MHFCNKDSQNHIRCAPKLSDAHTALNNFQKMSVKLASQVFSDTVASGMLSIYSSGHLTCPSNSYCNTAKYILFINKLFDIFNSSNFEAIFSSKKVFSATPEQLQFLDEALKLLKTISVNDDTGADITSSFNYLKGWILNINSLKRLWRFLSRSGFQHIQTRRLCQDNLENYFGQIRMGGGRCVRITPYMFCNLFKKSWGLRYANLVTNGNCEPTAPNERFSPNISNEIIESVCNDRLMQDLSWQEFQGLPRPEHSFNRLGLDSNFEVDDVEVDFFRDNAFAYVSCYFYLKIFRAHTCSQPLPYLGDDFSVEYLFTHERQIHRCNLIKPPQGFLDYLKEIEIIFVREFDSICHRIGVGQLLFDKMKHVSPYKCCNKSDSNANLALYIRIRIFFALKFFNRNLSRPHYKTKILCVSHM